jgi:hypothetical protein
MTNGGAAVPNPPARVPNRNRHVSTRVRQSTRRKKTNTVADATVDMQADIEAINRGEATRAGDLWTIRGRTYCVDARGHAWPVSGPGLYILDRRAFLALAVYNEHGLTDAAERLLDLEGVPDIARAAGRRVWQVGRDVR